MTVYPVSGRPRQFFVMKQNRRCSILFHYDRSKLILGSIKNLRNKLIEESIIVGLVCILFLFHLRGAMVAILVLPIAILLSFIAMVSLGVSSNIMSLGGIAIAIGAMVDAAVVMIENAHKWLERWNHARPCGACSCRHRRERRCRWNSWPTSACAPAHPPSAMRTACWAVSFSWTPRELTSARM